MSGKMKILIIVVVIVTLIAWNYFNDNSSSRNLGINGAAPNRSLERFEVKKMNISPYGVKMIKRHEGLASSSPTKLIAVPESAAPETRIYPYRDSGGKLTIGYGHTKTANVGMDITKAFAEYLLLEDLNWAVNAVKQYVKVPLTQNQFDALVSFTFNLGGGNLRTLIDNPNRLNSGNYEATANAIKLYNKDNGKVIAGLTTRRNEESELFLS